MRTLDLVARRVWTTCLPNGIFKSSGATPAHRGCRRSSRVGGKEGWQRVCVCHRWAVWAAYCGGCRHVFLPVCALVLCPKRMGGLSQGLFHPGCHHSRDISLQLISRYKLKTFHLIEMQMS